MENSLYTARKMKNELIDTHINGPEQSGCGPREKTMRMKGGVAQPPERWEPPSHAFLEAPSKSKEHHALPMIWKKESAPAQASFVNASE